MILFIFLHPRGKNTGINGWNLQRGSTVHKLRWEPGKLCLCCRKRAPGNAMFSFAFIIWSQTVCPLDLSVILHSGESIKGQSCLLCRDFIKNCSKIHREYSLAQKIFSFPTECSYMDTTTIVPLKNHGIESFQSSD